jgi:hypothetical protein
MGQCEGRTQKGERCKREARDGSPFCAIHMDQAERPRRERPGPTWTSQDLLEAAIGFGVLAAIVFLRIRR